MNDHLFDEDTAKDWIRTIESPDAKIRLKDFYPKINQWMDYSTTNKILDIGCGQGDLASHANLKNREYFGIDPSPYLIQRACERLPELEENFSAGNAYQIPFKDSSFDSVISIAVWHLLENIQVASQELSRVLSVNGAFLIALPDPTQLDFWKSSYSKVSTENNRLLGQRSFGEQVIEDTLFFHSLSELNLALKNQQLSVLNTDVIRCWMFISGKKSK